MRWALPRHDRWGETWSAVLDAVFPPRCAGCGLAGEHFCVGCTAAVEPVLPPWCSSCGQTVAMPAGGVCRDCAVERLRLAGVRSAGLMRGPLRRAVHRLKYGGATAAAASLAALMAEPARSLLAGSAAVSALVVPVPLSRARQRERGYNQAERLAAPLAAMLGLELATSLLRVRETAPQVGLSRAARRANVRGAFSAAGALPEAGAERPPRSLEGACVLLVDDVTTTGSTLGSAASACLEAGAQTVNGVTLAREA